MNANVCSKKIKEISELDVVVQGSPFSDKVNEDGEEEEDDDDDEDEDEDEDDDDAEEKNDN